MNTLVGRMLVRTVWMVHHTSVVAYAFTKQFTMSMLLSDIMHCHVIILQIIGSISNKYINIKILYLFFFIHFFYAFHTKYFP